MHRRIKSNKSLSAIIYTLLNHLGKTRQTIRHPLLFLVQKGSCNTSSIRSNFQRFSAYNSASPFVRSVPYKFNCATSQDLLYPDVLMLGIMFNVLMIHYMWITKFCNFCKLKRSKSPRSDGISTEVIKSAGVQTASSATFNSFFRK